MSTWPAPDRPDTPGKPEDGRISLETWPDCHRTTLLQKSAGLTPEQLADRWCPPTTPPPLSLLGLVRHLTTEERIDGVMGD